jgi:hypothetical protein
VFSKNPQCFSVLFTTKIPGQKKHFFYKNVIFILNILMEFGIIQTAIEMAGMSRRTASRKPPSGKDIACPYLIGGEPAGQVKNALFCIV